MTQANDANTLSFEQAITELERIISALEQGELPLDEALKQFEQAVQLSRLSQEKLHAAEQKVQLLLQQQGTEQLVDATEFNPEMPAPDSSSPF